MDHGLLDLCGVEVGVQLEDFHPSIKLVSPLFSKEKQFTKLKYPSLLTFHAFSCRKEKIDITLKQKQNKSHIPSVQCLTHHVYRFLLEVQFQVIHF